MYAEKDVRLIYAGNSLQRCCTMLPEMYKCDTDQFNTALTASFRLQIMYKKNSIEVIHPDLRMRPSSLISTASKDGLKDFYLRHLFRVDTSNVALSFEVGLCLVANVKHRPERKISVASEAKSRLMTLKQV